MKKMLLALLAFATLTMCFACASLASLRATPTPAPTPLPTPTAEPTPTATPTPSPTPEPQPIDITLYVPNDKKKWIVAMDYQIMEDTPQALLGALIEVGALPDVDYGRNMYFEIGEDTVKIKGEKENCKVVRADFSQEFGNAIKNAKNKMTEKLMMQSLVDTFLAYYDADAFALTIEGSTLETKSKANYEHGMVVNQFVKILKPKVTPTPKPTPSPASTPSDAPSAITPDTAA